MNIVIFGGSFDPIHCGHIAIIQEMLKQINVDRFFLIPAGDHPESKSYLFSNEQRLTMIKESLLEFNLSNVEISEWEIYPCQSKKSYTIDTLKHFSQLYPNDTLHLLIGSDQAQNFSKWYHVDEIVSLATLWVYPRKDFTPDPKYSWNILDVELQNVSSTLIREFILQKDSISTDINDLKIPRYIRPFLQRMIEIERKK